MNYQKQNPKYNFNKLMNLYTQNQTKKQQQHPSNDNSNPKSINNNKIQANRLESSYKRYVKHHKNQQQSSFSRLKAKLNHILNTRDSNQKQSVSYYDSEDRQSIINMSQVSMSIQSNKRFVVPHQIKDKQENHKIKNDEEIQQNKIEQNQFLRKSFIEKKQKRLPSQFIFFNQPHRIQNIKEANKRTPIQEFKVSSQQLKQKQTKDNFQLKRQFSFKVNQQNQNQNNNIFEPVQSQNYEFQQQKISQVSHISKSVNFSKKQTNKKQLSRSVSNMDEMQQILVEINKQDNLNKKQFQQQFKEVSDSNDKFQQISDKIKQKHSIPFSKNKQSNISTPKQFQNIFQSPRIQSVVSFKSDKYQQIDQQFQRKQAGTLNLKQKYNFDKKRNSDYVKPQPSLTQNQEPRFKKSDYEGLKQQLEEQLIQKQKMTNKVEFKVELKKRQKSQVTEKQSKKFTNLLKKRQQALAKKVRQQLQNQPRQIFYQGSVSKQSSFKSIDKISSPQLITMKSNLNPRLKQTQTNILPSIGPSPLNRTINPNSIASNSFKTPHKNISHKERNRLKSQNSNYSSQNGTSFEAQPIRFSNPDQIQSLSKINYQKLNHYMKENKTRNINPKQKFQRLKKLLQQS